LDFVSVKLKCIYLISAKARWFFAEQRKRRADFRRRRNFG